MIDHGEQESMKTLPFLLTLLLAAVAPAADKPPVPKGVKNATVEEFDKLRAGGDVVVLDVRTPKEFAAGHIPGAVNLDWNASDFTSKAAKLDTNKTYLVHCAGGVRSAKACGKLHELNFPKLVNLEPGFRDWEKAGKPVEKAK
jgi:rhodanese-related sulfurtransferase